MDNFATKRGKEILEHLEHLQISDSLTDSEKNDLELISSKKSMRVKKISSVIIETGPFKLQRKTKKNFIFSKV